MKDKTKSQSRRRDIKKHKPSTAMPTTKLCDKSRKTIAGTGAENVMSDIKVIGMSIAGGGGGARTIYVKRGQQRNAESVALPLSLLTNFRRQQLESWLCESGFEDIALAGHSANFRAHVITATQSQSAVVTSKEGLHTVNVGGEVRRCFVIGGKIFWLGGKPEEKVLRLAGKAAIRSGIDETMAADALIALTPMLKRNPRLLVTLCVALSADIQQLFGITVPCLGLIGGSSLGKTTIQRVCNLLLYGEERVIMLNATTRGLEKLLADNPERAIFVDDAQGKDAGSPLVNAIMSIGNQGARFTALGETAQVRATLIYSAEAGLVDTARISNAGVTSGVFARVLEIRAGAHGMFDDLCGQESGAALSAALIAEAKRGSQALRVNFLREVAREWGKAEAWWTKHRMAIRSRILHEVGGDELSEVNSRLVDGLVFAAYTGCLLGQFEVLKWSHSDVYEAFGLVLKEYFDRQDNQASPVASSVVDDVRYFIQSNPQKFANFATAGDVEARNGIVGFHLQSREGTREYLFFPEAFKRLFVDAHGEECYRHLKDAGYLLTQDGRNNRKLVRIPGTTQRWNFNVISGKILSE